MVRSTRQGMMLRARTTGVSLLTAAAVVASLFTVVSPAAADDGTARDGFPAAPTETRVEGTFASDQEAPPIADDSVSTLTDELKPVTAVLSSDELADGRPLGDTGIVVSVVTATTDDAAPHADLDVSDAQRLATNEPSPSSLDEEQFSATDAPAPEQTSQSEPQGDIRVSILGLDERDKLGGASFALQIQPEGWAPSDEDAVQVTVPDELLAQSFGADYASRLRWTAAPAGAATNKQAKSIVPLEPVEVSDESLTFEVPAAKPMVLMAASAATSSSGAGSFASSPLKPSSSWDVSAQTGAFAWSLPIPVPPAPAGAAPSLSLSYNSQLVDGATASTNNQPSAVGEGWSLTGAGFIERRYVPCSQEQSPGAPVAGSADLCWATDNATISFAGRSGAIIRDSATGTWKLEGDDNSRVEKLVGTTQGCADNGTYNTECWRLTTTNGTQYFFGLNRLPGWSAGKETTNSAWTVPVFGNDAADPCHAATFAASSCQQGWRWNLDYVVDVNGNAQAFYYKAETNKYRLNNATATSYVRGGQLSRVEYGLKASTVYSTNAATGRIVFGYDAKGRCNPANAGSCSDITLGGDAATPASPSVYPDVPFDLNCVSGACTGQVSPSFFTTARLASISTQTFTGGSYKTADQFALVHSFPDPGDLQSPALWLESIQRTALPGTTQIVEAATTFQKTPLQNRVWTVDGLAPLDKFRMSSVTLPTGARISVNYSAQECTPAMAPGILAAPWNNDKRCFPQWWTADLQYPQPPKQDLFHKYVVTSMVEDPYTGGGGSPAIRTNYAYAGTPGWRYNDDPLIPADRRSWNHYAGYDKVEIRVGDPSSPSTQQATEYLFYRGLNGDRANASGGTKSVNVTGTTVPDDRWFGGQVRTVKTLNGVGGAVLSQSTTTPWASGITANDGSKQSRIVSVGRTDTTTPLSTGGTRTTSSINTIDARGFITQESKEAGAGQRATCTTTQYAADNTSAWIIGLPSVVTEYSVACSQVATAAIPATVLSHKRMAYDGAAVGAAASKGLVTTTGEASGFTGATLASADWVTSNTFTYDSMGRIKTSADAAGRTMATAYTPADTAAAGTGPVTVTAVTNPVGWITRTTVDAYRGLPVTIVDDNSKTTSNEYDALGRLLKVWKTDRPKASNPSSPSEVYEYGVFDNKPSYIKTTSLVGSGTMSTFRLYDGLGRIVQSQAPVVGGGALINDTEYDGAGRQSATNIDYWAPAVVPGSTLFVPATLQQIAQRSETEYDAAGRPTAQVLRSFAAEIRRTTNVYRGADRVDTTPPAGGVPTSAITDAWGRTTKATQWHGAIDAAGVSKSALSYEYNARDQMTRMTDDAGNVWTWAFDLRGRQTSTTDPDAGTSTFTYDALGNTTSVTDARNITLAYTYDALNRKTTERQGSATGTVRASWAYDTLSKGLLTSSSRFSGGLEYVTKVKGYDNAYRSTGSTVVIPAGAPAFGGTTYATSTYYNQDGSLAATVLPAAGGLPAEELYPSYDVVGRQNGLVGALTYATQVAYLPSGEVGQITRGGTTWSALTFGYDPGTGQLESLDETTRRGGTFTLEALRQYTRNPAGLITKASTTAATHTADIQCFRYSPTQALTDAWTPTSGNCDAAPTTAVGGPAAYRTSYQVDAVTGNRTKTTKWAGTTATVSTYSYPAAGSARPHAVQSVSTTIGNGQPQVSTYQQNAAGAMTKRGTQTLTYGDDGKLSTVVNGTATENSLYSADGELLMKWGGTDGASLHLGNTILRNKSGVTTGVRSYSVAGISIAERVSGTGGEVWWLSPDPVGTVPLQINVSTGVSTRRWMDPFGNSRGTATTWSSELTYLNAPKSATGLTQLGARAYDSVLGQFITTDPLLDTSESRHSNAYAYSFNSPVSYSDANGLRPTVSDSIHQSNPQKTVDTRPAPKVNQAPTAPGNGDSTQSGNPAPKEVHWWNPWTWDQDAWVTAGSIAVGVAAGVAIGACVVATAGICGAVGVGIGAVALATVGAGTSVAAYQLSTGPKTAEGGFFAALNGGAGGAVGGVAGVLLRPLATIGSRTSSTTAASAVAASSESSGRLASAASSAARAELASPDALASSGRNLQLNLASRAQLSEVGEVIAGGPGTKGLYASTTDRLVATYGGKAEDWVKMKSSTYENPALGVQHRTHWYENTSTGLRVEPKTKFRG